MRRWVSVFLVAAVVGCGEATDPLDPPPTTSADVETESTASVSTMTTSTTLPPLAEHETDDPGSEGIGVQERITITVIDVDD